MSQKKILLLTNRVPFPLKDGGNLAMNITIEGYARTGWQVYVLAMNTTRHHVSNQVLSTLYPDIYRFEWFDFDNRYNWMTLARNFFFSKQPEHVSRFYRPEFESRLQDVLTEFMPDVVQIESVFLTSYLPVINSFPEIVTVLRLHNIEYHIWRSLAAKTTNWFKKIFLKNLTRRMRRFERSAWRRYDLLLPITHKDAALVNKLDLPNKLIVTPFGIDTSKIVSGAKNEKWVAYHLGAMDWIPNRDSIRWFVTKVWPRIHKALPKFEFYFAGRHMQSEMNALAGNGVYCMNEVPSAEEFIADKKILIVPLMSGSGIRVKILEAMAAGKIVITTLHGIKGIEAKHNEHYLLANRPDDFLRTIKWCLENKDAAEKMAERARQLVVTKYDFRSIAQAVNEVLYTLIDEKQSL